MLSRLTLRPTAHFHDSLVLKDDDRTTSYDVHGLPQGQRAVIADMGERWQILRTKDDVAGDWQGSYASAEDALAALQSEISD